MKQDTEVLQITRASALKAYNKGDASNRNLLEELFPQQFGDITKRIHSWQDVFDIAGVDAKDYMETADMDEDEQYDRIGKRLRLLTKVYNGIDEATGKPWKPDYSNKNQSKHYCWLDYKVPSGFALYDVGVCISLAVAGLGSRHTFRSTALARDAYNKFSEDYNRYATM